MAPPARCMPAQAFAGGDPFLVLNSDNLYPASVLRSLIELDGPGLPAYHRDSLVHDSGFGPDRVTGFAAIEVDSQGYLTRIIEKPGRDYYAAAGPSALDQHERVALRRAHLRGVPRMCRCRRVANMNCRKPWGSP